MEISKKMAFLSAGALLVAFGCFCFACRGDVSEISESELTTLEQDLHQLAKNSESKQQLLTEQKVQLTEASQQWV